MSRCIFHRIQQQFDGEDKAALNSLLTSRGHLDVARAMTAAGFKMSEHTVRRHKKLDCSCEQVTV
jgi:hypothetical protein